MSTKHKLIRMVTHDVSFRELLKGQMGFMNQSDLLSVIGVSADTGELSEIGKRENIQIIPLKMEREISISNDIVSLFHLYKLFRREKPDIVHAHTPKAVLLAMTAGWLARVPNRIYTVTGLRFETASGILRFVLKSMERLSCAFATKVIPEGDGVAKTLREHKITKKPLKKILNGNINGVDLDYFNLSDDVVVKADEIKKKDLITFIFVGRIVKDKGIQELVDAFLELNKDFPDTRLILVGRHEANLDPLPEDTLSKIQSNSSIEWVGFQSDVRPWIAASDVLVLPSYREGFPNVILQACALGTPCIASDVNGCNEVIEDGKNGFIIPPRNKDELKNALLKFIKNRSLVSTLGEGLRDMIVDKFSNTAIWNATLDMYREELQKNKVKK